MSTNEGLFSFAAAFPPALISGKPGRVRSWREISLGADYMHEQAVTTFDSLLSVNTLQISSCLTTSHG